MTETTTTRASSLDELIGGKALLKLIVERLSSQLLLFSIAIIVFLITAFYLFDDEALILSIGILIVFVIGAVGYLFAEQKRKLREEEPEAVSRMLGAQMAQIVSDAPQASNPDRLAVELSVERVDAAGARDVTVVRSGAAGRKPEFRIGDRINIGFESNRDCYLTLLNVGTSGTLTILFPNALHSDNHVRAGQRHEIPGREYGFEFALQGPPGTERLKAIASLEPIRLMEHQFSPDGALFLQERPTAAARDIAVISEKTRELPADSWAEASVEFTVAT